MLITQSYLEQQKALHATGRYGTAGEKLAPMVNALVSEFAPKTLLDYGCGSRQSLKKGLTPMVEYAGYDPCVEKYAGDPVPADLVVCIDVMEHIEPQFIDPTIGRLRALTKTWCFVTVHTGPAGKFLSDGRNAHIVQEPPRWWLPKFMAHFDLERFSRGTTGFWVLLK